MEQPNATASIDVDAPADLVYDIVSDVTRLPEWAAETERCTWLGSATGPAVGARFRGRNRYRTIPWTTTCKVTAADPGRLFVFDVRVAVVRTATWEFAIEPLDGGCRVTESTRRHVPDLVAVPVNMALGVRNRDEHNQRNIETTLARLKSHAEDLARTRAG